VKVKQRDHKKLEDVTCDVCKTVKQKPNQVKLKVGGVGGGRIDGVVMIKINAMITFELRYLRCWM